MRPIVGEIPKDNHARYLGWQGYIDTEVELAHFFHEDHTIAGWFMPQYPHGYAGPIFAENGSGIFLVGQANYRTGNVTEDDAGDPVLFVQVGSKRTTYLAPDFRRGEWSHIAVVRRAGRFELYLNGTRLTPFKSSFGAASDVQVGATYANKPAGTLRFGRRSFGTGKSNTQWQAYGILDDVGVFRQALKASEVAALASKPRLSGKDYALWKGFGFDKAAKTSDLPATLRNKATSSDGAFTVKVSRTRRDSDHGVFGNPFIIGRTGFVAQLPFAKNEVWKVIQGYDAAGGSHNGNAAFSLDLVLAGHDQCGEYPKGTAFAPVYAVAPGYVEYYRIDHDPSKGEQEKNVVYIRTGNARVGYRHLEKGKVSAKVTGGTYNPDNKHKYIETSQQPSVAAGEEVAKLGNNGCHLHLGTKDRASGIQIPMAFSEFEVSRDGGKTWTPIVRGIPESGMLVRRTRDPKRPKRTKIDRDAARTKVPR